MKVTAARYESLDAAEPEYQRALAWAFEQGPPVSAFRLRSPDSPEAYVAIVTPADRPVTLELTGTPHVFTSIEQDALIARCKLADDAGSSFLAHYPAGMEIYSDGRGRVR